MDDNFPLRVRQKLDAIKAAIGTYNDLSPEQQTRFNEAIERHPDDEWKDLAQRMGAWIGAAKKYYAKGSAAIMVVEELLKELKKMRSE